MEPPKKATKWGLAGGVTVTSLLFYMIVEAKSDSKERDAALGIRIDSEVSKVFKELCRIRYRLDAQAGIPNPGGCE